MLSIIIATYHAPDYLDRAVASVISQTSGEWEAIISPDDGQDYSHLSQRDSRITVLAPSLVGSGPGATRNRGLRIASGGFVTSLDDDDLLLPNYVEAAVGELESCTAFCFRTVYQTLDETEVREVGNELVSMTVDDFSLQLGSMHVIGKRDAFPPWRECFAEDVLHTYETIKLLGGAIRISSNSAYITTVRPDSLCARHPDIDHEYDILIRDVEAHQEDLARLLRMRKKFNSLFLQAASGQDYNEFVRNYSIDQRRSILESESLSRST